jgi:ketosteroid isomerase-like protein
MSDPHPNVLTYLAAMAAFNRHDLTAVAEHVHPDFVYRIPGRSKIAGEFHGIEGFVEALTRLRDESDGTLELTPVAVLADDEHLLARARVTARRGGKRLDTEKLLCLPIRQRQGRRRTGLPLRARERRRLLGGDRLTRVDETPAADQRFPARPPRTGRRRSGVGVA